jgi:hypothetical protein
MTALRRRSAVAGLPAARAMLLVDGAEAIAGDLPRAATARVEVPPRPARRSTPASGASAR